MSAPDTASRQGARAVAIDVKCPPCGWRGTTQDLLKDEGPMLWCPRCRRATWVWSCKASRDAARDVPSEFRTAAIDATRATCDVENRLRRLGVRVDAWLDIGWGTYDAYSIQWKLDKTGKRWSVIYWDKHTKGKVLLQCSAAIRVQCAPHLKALEVRAMESMRTVKESLR